MSKSGGKAMFIVGLVLAVIVLFWGRVGFYASSIPVMLLLALGGVVLMAVGARINKGSEPNKAVAWAPTSAPENVANLPVQASLVEAPPTAPWALLAADGSRYPLLGPTTVIGRNPGPDDNGHAIALPSAGASVSKAHARLTIHGDEVRVRDLGSTNGTFVVDSRGVEHECRQDDDTVISAGSSLELGEYSLALVASDS